MSVSEDQVSDRLRRFVRKLKKSDELASFISALNSTGEAYLFGGAPRDVAFGVGRQVNDLDIFVSGPISADLLNTYSHFVRRTNFGGFRLYVGRFEVDAWELSRSHAFLTGRAPYISARALLDTVCFSTDGVAVSLKSGRISASRAFFTSLNDRNLDFVVPPETLDALVCARIARLALKLDLGLSSVVSGYFVRGLDQLGVPAVIGSESRWAGKRILNELAIEQIRVRVVSTSEAHSSQLRNQSKRFK